MHLKILLNQGAGILKKRGWAWQVRAFQSSSYYQVLSILRWWWWWWYDGDDMAMKMMMMMTMLLVILLMMMTKMTSRVWWLPLSWCMTLIKKTKEEKKVLPTVSFFWSYINIYWIYSFLYCWKQSRWRQWDVQFIVVKHLDFVKKESKCSTTTNCASPLVFVAKSANVYLATIIRLFLTASLTVAMYQKCTAFSPHVSSPHFYKYKNNCPTTPPRLLFNIYDGLSELTCRK